MCHCHRLFLALSISWFENSSGNRWPQQSLGKKSWYVDKNSRQARHKSKCSLWFLAPIFFPRNHEYNSSPPWLLSLHTQPVWHRHQAHGCLLLPNPRPCMPILCILCIAPEVFTVPLALSTYPARNSRCLSNKGGWRPQHASRHVECKSRWGPGLSAAPSLVTPLSSTVAYSCDGKSPSHCIGRISGVIRTITATTW